MNFWSADNSAELQIIKARIIQTSKVCFFGKMIYPKLFNSNINLNSSDYTVHNQEKTGR